MDEPQHTAGGPAESRHGGPEEFSCCEPAVLRYFRLLWKHRWLILGGSLLGALLTALVLYLWPGKYTATFSYERPLAESEYGVLLRRFHSQENLDKIIGRLQEGGLSRYVRRLDRARARQSFEKLIRFDVSPMYPKRLQTTDPCTSERISGFRARLLSVKVSGGSEEEVAGVSAVVTGNIESVLPIYDIRNHLKETLAKLRDDAAKIESDRFKLSTDLQKEKAKLEKFKALESSPIEAAEGSVVLQFNNAEKSRDYLPMSYQVRAVQSKVVDLQETLTNNAEKYSFYLQMLELDNQLLTKIEERLLTYYTAQEYLAFLREQLLACQDPALGDHLKSYIRKTENLVLVNTRAGERPVVYPVSKSIGARSALVFILFLMIATFVAVLWEHWRQPRWQAILNGGPGSKRAVTPLGMATPDRRPE
jgi:hypothetical protein